jgi:tetratricopeptide (TPR) repeat protein
MNDPAQAGLSNVINQATELIAAHGVYALTAIFIFYQQYRAGQSLKNAAPEDHAYFRKVYTSVVVATYTLMVLSTAIWFYANFMYSQRSYIKGTLMGLTEQRTPPSNDKEPAEILQEIAPASDVELYVDKRFSNTPGVDGKYDLCWVLFPKEKVSRLALRFEHHYEVWRAASPNANPFDTLPIAPRDAKTIPGLFGLDLGSIHYSPGHSIQLMYEPDTTDAIRNIGKMYLLRDDGQKIPLLWQDVNVASTTHNRPSKLSSGISALWSSLVVYAAGSDRPLFRENGDYDPALGGTLRERLGGTNLLLQMESVKLLVQQGNRSFKFIADSLSAKPAANYDEGLLRHNLASAADQLEAQGIHAPTDLCLQFAMTFYTNQDYVTAAHWFDRAGNEAIHDDETWFFRAYAHYHTQQYQQSARDYQQYLRTAHKPQYDAVARTGLADALWKLRRDDDAIDQYKRAIKLSPKYATAYNNLAYLYAERGEDLPHALDLVNMALQLETDERSLAEYKDTRGWILFKSGKTQEALRLIREAAAKVLDDPDVQSHLKIVEQAASGKDRLSSVQRKF